MIDAHVHLFPDRLFDAIWRWFDEHAWGIAHKIYADEVVDRLEEAGAERAVGLLYAHRPGMAEELNRWIGDLARRRPMVIPCATVHPRDEDLRGILLRGRDDHGARLVKQHCHVLGIAPDDLLMFPLYEACIELGLPLNLHVGNGPKLPGYRAPSDTVSGAARTEAVLVRYPELRLIVPHLGVLEDQVFLSWLDRFPNLYLDTAMAMVPFLDGLLVGDRKRLGDHPDRILFGTDFPNIPYPIETELEALAALGFEQEVMAAITHDTAVRVFAL